MTNLQETFELIQKTLKQESCLMVEEIEAPPQGQGWFSSWFGSKKPNYVGVTHGLIIFGLPELRLGKQYLWKHPHLAHGVILGLQAPVAASSTNANNNNNAEDPVADKVILIDPESKTSQAFELPVAKKGIFGSFFSSKSAKTSTKQLEDSVSSAIGAQVGQSAAQLGKSKSAQSAIGNGIASSSDNPLVKTLATNKAVQSSVGSAFTSLASNKAVQKKVGQAVVNKAKQSVKESTDTFFKN